MPVITGLSFSHATVHLKNIHWINPLQVHIPVMKRSWKWLCGDDATVLCG